MPTPLLAIQLLWVNLVTDSFPALALGVDPIQRDVMEAPPHKRDESIFSGGMGFSLAVEGCLVGALALLAYTLGRVFFDVDPANPTVGRTMAFCVLSLSQLVHSFNMRSEHSVLKLGLFSNRKLVAACGLCAFLMVSVVLFPPLAALFKTTALTLPQWLLVAALSLCPCWWWRGEAPLGAPAPKENLRGSPLRLPVSLYPPGEHLTVYLEALRLFRHILPVEGVLCHLYKPPLVGWLLQHRAGDDAPSLRTSSRVVPLEQMYVTS